MPYIADIEVEVLHEPVGEILSYYIIQSRRGIVALDRIMAHQRALISKFGCGGYSLVSERDQLRYRNIHDHVVRIEVLTRDLRDMGYNVLSTYLASVSDRMSEMIKALSILVTIFLPLTLLAGVYGRSFANMPER